MFTDCVHVKVKIDAATPLYKPKSGVHSGLKPVCHVLRPQNRLYTSKLRMTWSVKVAGLRPRKHGRAVLQ